MKGIKLFLTLCLALPAFGIARADDNTDTARAAVRRNTINQSQSASRNKVTTTAARGNATTSVQRAPTPSRATSARTTSLPDNTRGNTQPTVVRTASGISTRAASTARSTVARAITPSRTGTRTSTDDTGIMSRRLAATQSRATTRARSTESTLTRADVLTRDYSKCKTVYYDCMDEFCANKDSQLKRCACSTRVNEFDKVKKQLATVDEQMLEFSQRLLTVNMDKEDAAALFQATEGELAFNKKDTSDSKKMLDEIAKKLNTSFNDSNFDQSLNAISLSLNADAAFDSVDSLQGASTTTKTGVALYNAALPVCREMAAEVCTPDELAIVTSGYQMTIEQDCNTVFKTYQTQVAQARDRVRENSALLDMSRLDIYQKRNSDDILTCKSKMLEMLTDSTVCGKDLGKCLDTTGQYIDPTTGQAFLTANLVNLGNLITRPIGDTSWTSASNNSVFVSYLNSKKKFLAPAMENCQDIADYVWDEFIEDALAQIKLAQEAKLEEVRQSCTTLTAQCLSESKKSIEEFDARALSVFGVWADKTVNAMCADVKTACSALLQTPAGDTDADWAGGMSGIATDITYETILTTCREVGRACIIQACKSTSGNFGLCENIQTSINRKSIINRKACWNEVRECIDQAGATKLQDIYAVINGHGVNDANRDISAQPFYTDLYGTYNKITYTNTAEGTGCHARALDAGEICIYDWCVADGQCASLSDDSDSCRLCRMTEQIWGNCEATPTSPMNGDSSHNQIIVPKDKNISTLLSWFAQNTGTEDATDSCRDTSCGPGFEARETNNGIIICVTKDSISQGDGQICNVTRLKTPLGEENCCRVGEIAATSVPVGCCLTNTTASIGGQDVCVPSNTATIKMVTEFTTTPTGYYALDDKYYLVCVNGDISGDESTATDTFPSGTTVNCSGTLMLVTESGRPLSPDYATPSGPTASFLSNEGAVTYTLTYSTDGGWQWVPTTGTPRAAAASDISLITY